MHIKESIYLKLVDLFFKQQDEFEDNPFGSESERYKELFRAVAEFLDELDEFEPYEGTNQVFPKDLTQYMDEDDDGGLDVIDDCEPDLESKELEDFAQDGYFENMEADDNGFWS